MNDNRKTFLTTVGALGLTACASPASGILVPGRTLTPDPG
jgi:hypothetical protein